MSYRGDYRQRRLLTGHFITVTGGEGGEKEREKEERGRKTEREVRKTQLEESAGKGSGGLLWQEQGTKSSEGQILVC